MKKINILSAALVASASSLMMSCDRNNDPLIQENEVPNGTETLVYSVQVKQSSMTSGRVDGLTAVKVTVNQNGSIQTKTTDATGIVSFDKMKQGIVSVFVEAPAGYNSVNISDNVDCQSCDYSKLDVDQVEYDQLVVTLPKDGATVQGKLFADLDFSTTITAGETVPNTAVVIAKIADKYEPNVYKTAVQSDGTFKFVNLPEGVTVTFSIDFKKMDSATPPAERTFSFNGLGTYTLDVNNPLSLGNLNLKNN